jgi:hypothetical protein
MIKLRQSASLAGTAQCFSRSGVGPLTPRGRGPRHLAAARSLLAYRPPRETGVSGRDATG